MDGHAVRVVARREINQRVRDRGYLLTTLALVGGLTLLALALGLGGAAKERYSVGSLDQVSARVVDAARAQAPLFGVRITARSLADRAQARRLLSTGELDAVVDDGTRVIAEDVPAATLRGLLDTGEEAAHPQRRLEVERLVTAGRAESKVLALIALPLLFVLIYLPAYFTAASVVEEKASRVVEILLSSVRPQELLSGKVLGIGMLGLAQVGLAMVLGLGVGAAAGFVTLAGEVFVLAAAVLVSFVVGFLVYAGMFAVAGAVVARPDDLQYSALVPTVVLFVAFVAVSSQRASADSGLASVLAFLPPTAPLMVPLRVGAGAAAAWELALAVILNAGAVAAMLGAARRLYAGSILRFDGRVGLRDAWSG